MRHKIPKRGHLNSSPFPCLHEKSHPKGSKHSLWRRLLSPPPQKRTSSPFYIIRMDPSRMIRPSEEDNNPSPLLFALKISEKL
ncbi:hypothetical protein CDAR_512271 [Caerostris darwini]|uniref:Uncharacterized protein n=1 Tax=Caerostris darwini TaxID=1538125 RepID=A0AAV4WIA9_9ARAC|nr:hypothetical protein CDAR_512271 [Caerostris darwini]